MNAHATQQFAELPFERLKQIMFDRLHGSQSIGPPFDPRVGPEPVEWLAEQFQRADAGLRDRMTAAMHDFLGKVTDLEQWPDHARDDLLVLIQECGDGVVDKIRRLIRTRNLLNLADAGPSVHAGLLKCLISIGHCETPVFWMEQFELLGPKYGAVIFSGLIEHGLDVAAGYLPQFCADEHACQQIKLALPVLTDMFGHSEVARVFRTQFDDLPEWAGELSTRAMHAEVLPPPLDRDDLRLVIGSEEDWDHAQVILEALGTESIYWQRIAGLLDQQPALRERIAEQFARRAARRQAAT